MVIECGTIALVLSPAYVGAERRASMSEQRQPESRVVISRETLVPLGFAMAACGALFSGYLWLQAEFAGVREHVDTRVSAVSARLEEMRERLDRIETQAGDRWTETDMRLWTLELARRNPRLVLPDARHQARPGEVSAEMPASYRGQ